MARSRIIAWLLVSTLIAALGAAASGGMWLLYTESGLAWLTARVQRASGEGLTLEGAAGTLAHGATVRHILYSGKDIEVRVRDAAIRVSPRSLLQLSPRITTLSAAEVAVVSKPSEPRGRPPDSLELPFDFQLVDARISRLVIDLGLEPLELTDVQLAYEGGKSQHRVRELSLYVLGHAVALRGTIDARAPFALSAAVAAVRPRDPAMTLRATLSGNLSEIDVEGGGTSARSHLDARARVRPYDTVPLVSTSATVKGLDLQAVVERLPRTAIDGDVDLQRSGSAFQGHVRFTNSLAGPYDQGRLPLSALRSVVRTDIKVTRLTDLVADLGSAGALVGSGVIEGEQAKLALSTQRLNLAGLHGKMRQTALAGTARLTLARARQSIAADFAHGDIALKLDAEHSGNTVNVKEFKARARGGEVSALGKIDLDASQPFSAQAVLLRFDPAVWGDFPAGRINGTLAAKGTLKGPEADVDIAISDSVWLSAPLTARGKVIVAGERIRHADLDASIGGNRLSAHGTLGTVQDTLDVSFDATRLAVLDERLQGRARGTLQLSGAWRRPNIRFDITGAELADARFGAVKALDARGTVSAEAAAPLAIDATLRGVTHREFQLRSAAIKIEGTQLAHTGVIDALGERVDFRARARGGWRPNSGWNGVIEELVNRGETTLELAAPVAFSVGPQRAHSDPFELRFVGGRLLVEELAYERGRFSTAGRFNDLPLRPLVALAGAGADIAGTLRVNGDWTVTNSPRLRGSISVARLSGDVALGADNTIRAGLQTLALNATMTDDGIHFQAAVQSALANASADGRVTPTAGGTYSRASGLTFNAQVDVARLAPFAALIDTTMLIQGEAHARLQGGGTLGDPQITGPLTADGLGLALPGEGVALTGGTLKAQFTEREIRIDTFAIRGGEGVLTGKGTLTRAGFNDASLDWSATRLTVISRPDRKLVVSGTGNASLRSGKLAFTGDLQANEGSFDLAATTLPTLGDDVVIVGAKRPDLMVTPRDEKKTRGAVLDVKIALGNNVHLRGQGLDVWLSGDLRVQTNPVGEILVTGTVDAQRGVFVAYGQRLEIERGRLYFNGPVTNPGLDVLAMRKRQAVEAGVAVTGTLRQPLVRVVSNPPLPEGEALSWLVLGRAPDSAGAGELSALPLATSALIGKTGAPIARTLQLDEVGLRSGANAADRFLTIGKRVTDRLYVVFEQSLGGTESLLRLEMSVTQRIALRAQTGGTSLLGVFYRYSWD